MTYHRTNQGSRGFTIVELLIVIVVIGILAAITIVAYTGMQVRARDAVRTSSISSIKQSLEVYKLSNGQYPNASGENPDYGGWELSNDPSGNFVESLSTIGVAKTPVDPVNTNAYAFWYYRYPAGNGGCDVAKGGFYVLRAYYESAANKPTGNSMTSECTSPQGGWSDTNDTSYVYHSYEN